MTARTHERKPMLANGVGTQAIGGAGAGGGGKACAYAPSHGVPAEHRPQAIDVAAGLGLGAALTLSLALAFEGAPLGAGVTTLLGVTTLAMLHQEAHP